MRATLASAYPAVGVGCAGCAVPRGAECAEGCAVPRGEVGCVPCGAGCAGECAVPRGEVGCVPCGAGGVRGVRCCCVCVPCPTEVCGVCGTKGCGEGDVECAGGCAVLRGVGTYLPTPAHACHPRLCVPCGGGESAVRGVPCCGVCGTKGCGVCGGVCGTKGGSGVRTLRWGGYVRGVRRGMRGVRYQGVRGGVCGTKGGVGGNVRRGAAIYGVCGTKGCGEGVLRGVRYQGGKWGAYPAVRGVPCCGVCGTKGCGVCGGVCGTKGGSGVRTLRWGGYVRGVRRGMRGVRYQGGGWGGMCGGVLRYMGYVRGACGGVRCCGVWVPCPTEVCGGLKAEGVG